MKPVAIFDIDGTIFRSSLLIELVNMLIEKEIFPPDARKIFEDDYTAWVNREDTYERYIQGVVSSFLTYLKGVHYGELKDTADIVLEHHRQRVYRYTRDLLKELKGEGYFLLAISHSPKLILDGFCKNLGFDKVYGMIYEIGPEGRFTGTIEDEHIIRNKVNVLRRALEKEHLDLRGSIGVGDTESDISFLEMVERPICFNPNAELYRYARLNDWKVVVERKDVIYEL